MRDELLRGAVKNLKNMDDNSFIEVDKKKAFELS